MSWSSLLVLSATITEIVLIRAQLLQAKGVVTTFSGITARSIQPSDFEVFDKLLVADRNNLEDVLSICPPALHHKIALFLSYGEGELDEIPDPYYGGARGFEYVLDLVEDAADRILDSIQTTL